MTATIRGTMVHSWLPSNISIGISDWLLQNSWIQTRTLKGHLPKSRGLPGHAASAPSSPPHPGTPATLARLRSATTTNCYTSKKTTQHWSLHKLDTTIIILSLYYHYSVYYNIIYCDICIITRDLIPSFPFVEVSKVITQ